MIRPVSIFALLVLIYTLPGAACTTLPPAPPQPEVNSLSPASERHHYGIIRPYKTGLKNDDSACLLLSRNHDALNWRLAVIDHATTSIDVQYFIWQDDETGNLLFDRMLRATESRL